MSYPEVKIELSKMRKSLPLEKSRTDSAISSKMYLTIQRLTLQVRATHLGGGLREAQAHLSSRRNWFSVYTLFCSATLDPGLEDPRARLYGGRSQHRGMGKGRGASGSSALFPTPFPLSWTLVQSCCKTAVSQNMFID